MIDVYELYYLWLRFLLFPWVVPVQDNEAEALRNCLNIHSGQISTINKALIKEGIL